MNYTILCDYETSERAGAGGMFQVAQLMNEDGDDCTALVDVGKHYRSFEEVKIDLAKKTGKKPINIGLEEAGGDNP